MKDRCVDDIILSRTWQLGGGEAVTKEQVESLPRNWTNCYKNHTYDVIK